MSPVIGDAGEFHTTLARSRVDYGCRRGCPQRAAAVQPRRQHVEQQCSLSLAVHALPRAVGRTDRRARHVRRRAIAAWTRALPGQRACHARASLGVPSRQRWRLLCGVGQVCVFTGGVFVSPAPTRIEAAVDLKELAALPEPEANGQDHRGENNPEARSHRVPPLLDLPFSHH